MPLTNPAEVIALLDKHAPADPNVKIGLSPARVRALVAAALPSKTRVRKRNTPRGRRYGWLKVAAANIPLHGIVVADYRQANSLQVVAKRMGIKLVTQKLGDGPARIVIPAPSGEELSRDSSCL